MFKKLLNGKVKKLLVTTLIGIFALNILIPVYANANVLMLFRAKAVKQLVTRTAVQVTIANSKGSKAKAKKVLNAVKKASIKQVENGAKELKSILN